jgi:glutathione S-transferase
MGDGFSWVLLAYRLPREPSTPRISVWRRLRRLGTAQIVDGLVALPDSPANVEQLEWAAEEVSDAGGEAWLWRAASTARAQDRALSQRLADAAAADYRTVIEAARTAKSAARSVRRRDLRRLRRALHAIDARAHVRPPEADQARAAVENLAEITEVGA